METVTSMETKLSFPALQTTICLEVREVDVLARNGIPAYQNAKVGFFFLQLALSAYFSARTCPLTAVLFLSSKEMKGGDEGERENVICSLDYVDVDT